MAFRRYTTGDLGRALGVCGHWGTGFAVCFPCAIWREWWRRKTHLCGILCLALGCEIRGIKPPPLRYGVDRRQTDSREETTR